jgi:hypothetical protein
VKGVTHELRAGEEAILVDAMTGDYRASFYAVARQRIVVPYGFRLETCASHDRPVALPRCQDAGASGQPQGERRPKIS